MYMMCFDQIHSPFFPLHFLFCLPSPLSPFSFMCSLFSFLNHLILLSIAFMLMGITYVHLIRTWRRSLGLPPPKKKKKNFPSFSSHQLPITSQLGVGLCEFFPIHAGFWLAWSCAGLLQVVTATVGWYVQHFCHFQKIMFGYKCLLLLALKFCLKLPGTSMRSLWSDFFSDLKNCPHGQGEGEGAVAEFGSGGNRKQNYRIMQMPYIEVQ